MTTFRHYWAFGMSLRMGFGRRWGVEIAAGCLAVAVTWKGLYVSRDGLIDGARPLVRWHR